MFNQRSNKRLSEYKKNNYLLLSKARNFNSKQTMLYIKIMPELDKVDNDQPFNEQFKAICAKYAAEAAELGLTEAVFHAGLKRFYYHTVKMLKQYRGKFNQVIPDNEKVVVPEHLSVTMNDPVTGEAIPIPGVTVTKLITEENENASGTQEDLHQSNS
jgi:hypothetical protein